MTSGITKNEDADQPPSQVSGETGASLTETVLRRMDALPSLDSRPENEILGYDKNGIPR